jgi:small-conductance mechanosensitive channel
MASPVRRYTRNLLTVFALYAVALVAANLVDMTGWPAPARLALNLAPAAAAILIVPVVLNFVASMDEVQRRIVTESCLVSMVVVGLGSFAYSFAQNAQELPAIDLVWIWPALIGVAGVAQIPVRMRYR